MDEELELPSDASAAPSADTELVLPSDDPNIVLPSDAPPKTRLGHAAGIVTDIPGKIYEAGSQALSGLNERFNPYSKTQAELQKKQLDPNASILDRMADEWANIKTTGAGIISAPALALSPLTGAARATVGNAFDAVAPRIDPEKAKKAGITPVTGDEVADLSTMAIAPSKGGLRAVHGPAEAPPAAPLPPEKPPFGVTLTEGEATGKLPLIQKEQAALRGKEILGEPAHDQAQMFAAQRKHELPAAKEGVAGELNPVPAMRAESPQAAAESITEILTQQHRAREATVAQRTQQLQNAHGAFRQALGPQSGMVLAETPLEAANIIGGSITHANEAARATTAGAYTAAREMPGKFPAASFNTLEAEIRGTLARGEQPKLINPQQHPATVSALGDIEDILSDLKQMRDPETGRVLPKEPNTMARVDLARQRLNTFLGDAIQTARNDSSAWKDVRALEDVIDAFDDAVAKRLRKGQFIGGDAKAVDAAFKEARALHADWARKFKPQGAGDKVGPAIRDILGRHEGQAATPEAVSNFLYGSGDRPVFVAKRLKQIFGQDSHEFAAARQGLYSHITEPPPGVTWTPEKLAANIEKYTRGAGRSLAEEYFTRPQINALQSFAEAQRVHARGLAATRDPADAVIAQLTGADTASLPSTQYAVQTLFNKALSNSKDAVAVIERLKQRLSPEQFGTYREGLYRAAMDQGMGLEGFGHKKIADNLTKLANSQAGRAAYSLEQLELLRQFAGLHRKLVVPQAGANWSNTANTAVNYMSKTGAFVAAMVGEVIGAKLGMPGAGATAYLAGKGAQKIANKITAKQIAKQMPLVADKVAAYNKALAAYNKSQNPLSTRAQTTAGINLSRALEQIGIDPSKLQLPGVSSASEDKEKKRAEGGAVEATPFEEPPLAPEGFYNGRYTLNIAPGRVPLQAANKPYEPSVAAPEPPQDPFAETPETAAQRKALINQAGSTGSKAVDIMTGLGGEERFQLWPEKMIRSGFTLAGDVMSGKEPVMTGLRRGDFTDVPEVDQSPEQREGGFWPFNKLAPVPWSPEDKLVGRVQDLAGMAGGTGFAMTPKGAVGTAGSRALTPASKKALQQYVGDDPYANSFSVNYALRDPNGPSPEIAGAAMREVPKIDAAFQEVGKPLGEDTVFYRMAPEGVYSKAGIDPGYTHVTRSKAVAEEMAGQSMDNPQVYAIKVPKGTPVVETDPFLMDGFPAEQGVLLPRGATITPRGDYLEYSLLSDSGKPGASLAALEKPNKPFYSAVEKAIENAPQNKMTPEQWSGWLKNQPGIKGEELNWLGLGDNPRGITPDWKGAVTKDELLGHVKEHGVELKEVEKGGVPDYDRLSPAEQRGVMQEFKQYLGGAADFVREYPTQQAQLEGARRWYADFGAGEGVSPKYGDYQLPGGGNYREMLVTLPKKITPIPAEVRAAADIALRKGFKGQHGVESWGSGYDPVVAGKSWLEQGKIAPEDLKALEVYDKALEASDKHIGTYSTNHWDEPNVLGHMRMNDRYIPDAAGPSSKVLPKDFAIEEGSVSGPATRGLKSMHLEELQSDWHQAGRKQGYGDRKPDPMLPPGSMHNTVPDAPFKQSWPDMLLKRAITKAAHEGYDSISWTPGTEQAARYSLSKQITALEVHKLPNGNYFVSAKQKGQTGFNEIARDVSADKLPDYIGKDLANKVQEDFKRGSAEKDYEAFLKENKLPKGDFEELAAEGAFNGLSSAKTAELEQIVGRLGYTDQGPPSAHGGNVREYSGVDLNIGGEGMKAFYDKMLVDKANAIGKKFGAKVEYKDLPGANNRFELRQRRNGDWQVFDVVKDKDTGVLFPVKEQAEAYANTANSASFVKVPVLRLTPELKAQVSQGMPLFQDAGKPAAPLSALERRNLRDAQKMYEDGAPMGWIKDDTGWVKTKQGKWKQVTDKNGLTMVQAELMDEWVEGNAGFQKLRKDPAFSKVLEQLPVYKGTVYRGLSYNKRHYDELLSQDKITLNKHSSASISRDIAANFANTELPLILQIDLKRGHKLRTGDDREVIMPIGTVLKRVGVEAKIVQGTPTIILRYRQVSK